jgi:hypothetical protein
MAVMLRFILSASQKSVIEQQRAQNSCGAQSCRAGVFDWISFICFFIPLLFPNAGNDGN